MSFPSQILQPTQQNKTHQLFPIASMYGILYLHLVEFYGKCRKIYQSHGWYGFYPPQKKKNPNEPPASTAEAATTVKGSTSPSMANEPQYGSRSMDQKINGCFCFP